MVESGRPSRPGTAALFLAPTVGFGAILYGAPILLAFVASFTRWDGLAPPRWTGFANYESLLARDPAFLASIGRTLIFATGQLALGLPLALGASLLLRNARARPLWRALYWLPMVTNVVAVATMWSFVLSDGYGLANRLLTAFGLAPVGWLTDPDVALLSVTAIFVWMHIGQQMLILSDGLDEIDPDYAAAARLDGASEWQAFVRVTLPLLRPALLFVAVTGFVQAMSTFALMLVLTSGGPGQATSVAPLAIYQMAFDDLRIGRSFAASFILLALVLAGSLVQLRLLRRGGVEAWVS